MSQKPTNQSDGIERGGQFLVYEAEDGKLKIDVRLEDETLWLPQAQLAELFQTSQQNVSLHIQHIYEDVYKRQPQENPWVKCKMDVFCTYEASSICHN